MEIQNCDQAVTFRNFDYSRELEIVQDEKYLEDVDYDEMRLSRKQGEVFQAIDNFQEKKANDFDFLYEDSDILGQMVSSTHCYFTRLNPKRIRPF